MADELAYSMALDLLFNGQDMDYCERPISLKAFGKMTMFSALSERSTIGVVGAGGGRLVKDLVQRGYVVDAFESRIECVEHLEKHFGNSGVVRILPMSHLNDPIRRDKLHYQALICMDDLRAFRDHEEWTEHVQKLVKSGGYFVYSQVSNLLPDRQNTLSDHFRLIGNYNVSEETAKLIWDSYNELDDWDPGYGRSGKEMAMETLGMVKSASSLRRNIRSGVEVRYFVWQRLWDPVLEEDE